MFGLRDIQIVFSLDQSSFLIGHFMAKKLHLQIHKHST